MFIVLFFISFFSPALHAADTPAHKPALVRPPDILTEEAAHPAVQSGNAKKKSETENLPQTSKAREQLKTKSEEPLPQIRLKDSEADANFHPESRYIEHPNAAKGLIKIDKDRVYHYKVKTSDQTNAGTFHIAWYKPLDLVNPDNSDLNFDDMYDSADFPLLLYDHEFQFFKGFGRLAWKVGGGFYYAQGNGKFKESNPDPNGPSEQFTLFVFPLNVGATYRFQYFSYQWIVPYVEGAFDAFCFAETRDDNLNPSLGASFGLAPAAHASGGVSVLLGKGASAFLDLDREYGINAVYLTAEFRQYFALSDKYDFSGTAISGGVTAEY